MPSWRTTLTAAGISGQDLRVPYTAAARRVRRREPAPYLVLRLLAAPALVPHVAAGIAFMNLVDDVAEHGSPEQRADGLRELTARVERALDGGPADDPVLRAYAHTVAVRGLPRHWVTDFLKGAAEAEARFTGFDTERDFEEYLDVYAWPGVMVSTGVQYPGGPDEEAARGWRRFVDAAQRVDFLADLAGDLREGRLCLPRERLAAFGVERAELERAADTPGVRALLADGAARAGAALEAARGVVGLADPGLRPVVRTMVELMEHQLRAVERAGTGALREDVGYGLVAPLRVLLRARSGAGRRG